MEWLYALAVLAAVVASVVVLGRIDTTVREWRTAMRSRLLLGVPWGTLVAVAVVVFVYLVVQSGYGNLRDPVVIPFQSWSYTYPTGWLVAGVAHSGFGHLLNNVTSMLVIGAIAESAYGHFPQRRGAASFASRRSNPYVRAFVIVPVALLVTALFSSLFALGPVIGFSGVVFAVAGFAIVRYPLGTVLGLLGIDVLRRLYDAVDTPLITTGFVETGPSPPWWAEVAIQGHAIGFLLGVLVGIYVFRRRDTLATPGRLFVGVLLFAVAQNLWAVYWFEGTDRWILLRGLGVLLVVVLAVVVAVAVVRDRRRLVGSVTRRQLGVAVLALTLAVLIGPAVALNLIATDPGEAADRPGVEVDDYRVIYAEEVVNQMVAVGGIDIGGLGEVRTSGVIVYSEDRNIWYRAVSSAELSDRGWATIHLGDVATRETVTVLQEDWQVTGNASVYHVWLHADGDWALSFESDPSTADAQVANHTVTIHSHNGTFYAEVRHDDAVVDTVPIPEPGEAVDVGDVTLDREDDTLYLLHDGTRVAVASR